MRKKLIFVFILTFGLISFAGCAKTSEEDAQQVAKQFITQFYDLQSTKSNETLQSVNKITSAHNKFKTIMTEEGVQALLKDRMYLRNMLFSANNKCTIKIHDINLSKRFYDEKEKKAGFDYVATIEVIYDKDKKVELTEEQGYVGLAIKNNKWKVYSNTYTKFSEMLIKK